MTDPVCPWCDEAVLATDKRAPTYQQPMHYECGLRSAVGSIGHQQRRCFCFGGTEEDPPGLTRRQAATAAALYFHLGSVPKDFLNQLTTQ